MVCSFFYSGIAFCSGVRLSQLVKETTAFRDLSIRYRLKTAITIANIILQLFHNFSGKATDPLVLTGEALDEKETLLETNGKHPVAYMCLLIYKHQLAVYMNDFSEAQRISAVIQRGDMGNIFPFLVSSHVFMEGLVVSRLSQTSKQQWTRANRMLSKLRRYAKHCPQNFQGKVYLVEAELAASTGDVDGALVKYKESIERACSQGHIHEEALAYERAGYALRYCGRMEEARDFLDQAKSRYASWGARAKVNQLGSIA
jgi:tetratricopeptide (TPR) repeat protein